MSAPQSPETPHGAGEPEPADAAPVFDVTGLASQDILPTHIFTEKPSRPYKLEVEGDFDSDVVRTTITGDHKTAHIVSAATHEALDIAKRIHEETRQQVIALGGSASPAESAQRALEAAQADAETPSAGQPVSLTKSAAKGTSEQAVPRRRGALKALGDMTTRRALRKLTTPGTPRPPKRAAAVAVPVEPQAPAEAAGAPHGSVAEEVLAMLKKEEGKVALKFKDMNPAQRAGATVVAALCVMVPWQVYSIGTGEAPLRLTSPMHIADPLVGSVEHVGHLVCKLPLISKVC